MNNFQFHASDFLINVFNMYNLQKLSKQATESLCFRCLHFDKIPTTSVSEANICSGGKRRSAHSRTLDPYIREFKHIFATISADINLRSPQRLYTLFSSKTKVACTSYRIYGTILTQAPTIHNKCRSSTSQFIFINAFP